MTKTIWKYLKIALILLVFIIICKYLYSGVQAIFNSKATFNCFYLIISLILLIIFYYMQSLLWYINSVVCEINIKYLDTFIIWNYSNIAKYIPGKIISFSILIDYYLSKGKQKRNLFLSLYIDSIGNIINPTIVIIISILFAKQSEIFQYKVGSFLILIIGIGMVHPFFLQKILDVFSFVLKKEKVKVTISYYKILFLFALNSINWFLYALSFFFLLKSFSFFTIDLFFIITAVLSLSSIMGFITFFTPGGIGGREITIVQFMKKYISYTLAGFISVFSRFLMICIEFLLFLIALFIDRKNDKIFWKRIINGK